MSFVSHNSSSPQESSSSLAAGSSISSQLSVNRTASGKLMLAPIPEVLSFDTGFFLALRAVQLLRNASEQDSSSCGDDSPPPLVVVALGGPSGAGKTVFAEKLCNMLPGSALISLDCYNDGSKVRDDNFDDERLTDYDTLLANLSDLRAGKPTEVPVYCYKASKRIGTRTVAQPTSRVLLLEGIYALSSTLRPHVDLRIAITGGVHKDLVKRVLRDVTRTKQSPREIIQQISETVFPMFKAYIEPDLQTAQLRIRNEWNPFTGLVQQPTYTMKAPLPLAAPAAAATGDDGHDVARIAAALGLPSGVPSKEAWTTTVDTYLLPPHEEAATCATWLRLRAVDGRYFLIFDEFLSDGPFIISPCVRFEVGIRVLGGLMALGYTIGCTLRRRTVTLDAGDACGTVVKLDVIRAGHDAAEPSGTDVAGRRGGQPSSGEAAGSSGQWFCQVQGRLREAVEEVARRIGMAQEECIPLSYIQQVQNRMLGGITLRSADGGGDMMMAPAAIGGGSHDAFGPSTPGQSDVHPRASGTTNRRSHSLPLAHHIGNAAHEHEEAARVDALCHRVEALTARMIHGERAKGGAAASAPATTTAGGALEALARAHTALAAEVGRMRSDGLSLRVGSHSASAILSALAIGVIVGAAAVTFAARQ